MLPPGDTGTAMCSGRVGVPGRILSRSGCCMTAGTNARPMAAAEWPEMGWASHSNKSKAVSDGQSRVGEVNREKNVGSTSTRVANRCEIGARKPRRVRPRSAQGLDPWGKLSQSERDMRYSWEIRITTTTFYAKNTSLHQMSSPRLKPAHRFRSRSMNAEYGSAAKPRGRAPTCMSSPPPSSGASRPKRPPTGQPRRCHLVRTRLAA